MDNRIDNLVHRLINTTNDPGEIHICPICGGVLHVKFSAYVRHRKKMIGVNIWCDKCKIDIMSDYKVENAPPWISW